MPFEYGTNLTAVYNALVANNTTTSTVDLSSGLTTRIPVDSIFKADPETVGIRNYQFPQIFIRINNKAEEYAGLGETGPSGCRKFADISYEVVGLVKKEGAWNTNENQLSEIYTLARNIEGVFQKEMTLSGTALWCNPVRTDFIGPFEGNGIWVKGVSVELVARYMFR